MATVSTATLLTGDAARVMPGPLGQPQDEPSYAANGILPWGPVQAIHTVTNGQVQYVINQLTSPDPFTPSYQLPNGSLVQSTLPVEVLATWNGQDPPETPTQAWTSPAGDPWEIIPGRVVVVFKPETTEAQIQDLIDEDLVDVHFSWFEQLEADKESSASLPGSSAGLESGGGGGEQLLMQGAGNQIAWFEFDYNQQEFPTIDSVLAYFSTSPLVENVVPAITDYGDPCFAPPATDPFLVNTDYYQRRSLWTDAYNVTNSPLVQAWPYPGRQQVIAVVDSGVWRGHPDMGPLTTCGVEVTDRTITVVPSGGGQPIYPVDKPQQFQHPSYGRLWNHGTQIASLINAKTSVGPLNQPPQGNAGLAPGALILPVRMKAHTKFHGFPQIPDWFVSWGISAPIKAIRALRFNFAHNQQGFDVRVVNFSWAYPAKLRTLPWVLQWSTQDIDDVKKTLSLDLAKNDRLYIGAASNEGTNRRVYPASHDNVLGVSGYDYDPNYNPIISYKEVVGNASNYFIGQNYYAVSGFYICGVRSSPWRYYHDLSSLSSLGWGASTPPLPGFAGYFPLAGWNDTYDNFGGTSAAVPQSAALAYHLYSRQPTSNWTAVKNRIVNTRGRTIGGVHQTLDVTSKNLKGPADFVEAINGW